MILNGIQAYSKVLRIRNSFKKIQQLSWTVSKLENRFDIDDIPTEELHDIFDAYKPLVKEVANILAELKDEYVETTDTSKH